MSPETNWPPRRRQFFILGIWFEPGDRPDRPAVWRISLEDPHTAQRSGFTSLASLEAYLAAWMEQRADGDQ